MLSYMRQSVEFSYALHSIQRFSVVWLNIHVVFKGYRYIFTYVCSRFVCDSAPPIIGRVAFRIRAWSTMLHYYPLEHRKRMAQLHMEQCCGTSSHSNMRAHRCVNRLRAYYAFGNYAFGSSLGVRCACECESAIENFPHLRHTH